MITSCSKHMERDRRLKSWGKKVCAADIDLDKYNGYSLGGVFVNWDSAVTLSEGFYLVCAAEKGSIKNHAYEYIMVDWQLRVINPTEKDFRGASEEYLANARNSRLYTYSLYIATRTENSVFYDVLIAERERLKSRIQDINNSLREAGYDV